MDAVGDYELLEKIAEGGMGAVYKARRRGGTDIVAVKILTPHLVKNPVLLKRFEVEYNATRALDHPNLVRALDFGYEGVAPYLVMEFVDGESLGDKLERDGAMPEGEAIKLISQVASGLQRAHREGLVHRDVKPDNILINAQGVAKLADMGLVKEVDNDLNLTRTGRGLGTPHFMAPEQFRNAKYVDARSDIYSLGATLYMMVTGELPFKSLGPVEAWTQKSSNKLQPAREIVPTLSERVDWAIRRAMQAEPTQRPASCFEFVEDLTGRSTKPLEPVAVTGQELWYLRFTDEEGAIHTVQQTMMSIRRSIKSGTFEDPGQLRASKNLAGPFEALRKLPEFRDLVVRAEVGRQKRTPAKIGAATPGLPRMPSPPPTRTLPIQRTPTPAAEQPPALRETPRPSSSAANRRPKLAAQPKPAPPPPAPMAEPSVNAPLVELDLGPQGSSFDWSRGLLIVVLGLVAATGGFFLLQHFLR